jgi:ABC-type multidrug transport system ATPase subunit
MSSAPITTQPDLITKERSALVLHEISKRWRGAEAAVLDRVELVVEPGAVVCVSGVNGAGKTTLLRIAAGVVAPDAGRVQLGPLDAVADRTEFQRRIGYVSTSPGLYARLTVRDHLRFWSRLALLPRDRRVSSCERVLDAFGLRPLATRRVDRMSMGQRQRVRLAGAFLHDPEVVLLDEPGTSLDAEGLELLASEVRRMRAAGRSAVYCAPTGTPDVVAYDRRVVIEAGRLVVG